MTGLGGIGRKKGYLGPGFVIPADLKGNSYRICYAADKQTQM